MFDLRGITWTKWRSVPPPVDTVVIAHYGRDQDKPFMCKTCKRGCCIDAGHGPMVLPEWWAWDTNVNRAMLLDMPALNVSEVKP